MIKYFGIDRKYVPTLLIHNNANVNIGRQVNDTALILAVSKRNYS